MWFIETESEGFRSNSCFLIGVKSLPPLKLPQWVSDTHWGRDNVIMSPSGINQHWKVAPRSVCLCVLWCKQMDVWPWSFWKLHNQDKHVKLCNYFLNFPSFLSMKPIIKSVRSLQLAERWLWFWIKTKEIWTLTKWNNLMSIDSFSPKRS